MNPLTYLGFTIFSIIMQFCVMEFIHERFLLDKDSTSFNESFVKNNDLIKNIQRKPHALFYRTEKEQIAFKADNNVESKKYSNKSSDDVSVLTSTDISSSTFEVFYENTSIIEDYFTTESYFTSSEFDNVTEITFLDKINTTTAKQSPKKTVTSKKRCLCNLLYQQCDINCCCDTDCTEEERSLFINCGRDGCDKDKKGTTYICKSYSTCTDIISTDVFNDIFCIVKINVPDKRIKSYYKVDALNATFKWNNIEKSDVSLRYKKNKYVYGDPVFLIKNEATLPFNLPTTAMNSYCNGKKPLKFLVNENIKCYFNLKDFYMFSALTTLEGTKLISITELSVNTTVLNCSTLHCTNWKILACNDNVCGDYNKTIHAPICTDNYCNNLAHTMDFTFHYFESKIMNASLKLYLTKTPTSMQLLTQEITVNWYIGNESIDDIIQLSGNPGYIPGKQLIVSSATNNHTTNFYNRTYGKSFLTFPQNINGQCSWLNNNHKTLPFGLNTRSKCRLRIIHDISLKNATSACHAIQTNIRERLRFNQTLYISPYGNPRNVNDDKWILLENSDRIFIFGEYSSKKSKLICNNLVARYEFVIAYADVRGAADLEENKIVKATVSGTPSDETFDLADLSIILTIDISFIDISKPLFEFARAPHLNIHLPANFFFDLPLSNGSRTAAGHIVIALYYCLLLLMKK